jgi:ElaA protein
MDIVWNWLPFDDLSVALLYSVLQLRQQVFVVEQNCVFLEADGKDIDCVHGCAIRDGQLVAYGRVAPPGLLYPETSIGRVAVALSARGDGLGRQAFGLAMKEACVRFDSQPITIGAQCYLQMFYESFGFVVVGEPYDLEGIPHVDMTCTTP